MMDNSEVLEHEERAAAPSSNIKDIRRSAMDLLARREHSRLELARKLHRRYSEYDLIEAALDKLVSDSLLSDERFTEVYVTYRKRAGFGPVRIAGELRERGVSDSLTNRYLDGADGSWRDAAAAARDKKFGPQPVTDLTEKARQQKFLSYRGFRHNHFDHIL
jgi:regulatory protein